jgi:hypothetical protein
MTMLRFPSTRRELVDLANALHEVRVLLEVVVDDLTPLLDDPTTLDDIETVVAILDLERCERGLSE